MSREEQQLDYANGSENNSTITFGEIIDYQAWRNTFTNRMDSAPSQKAGTIEIPGLPTRTGAPGTQPDSPGSDIAATANVATAADGVDKKDFDAKPANNPAIKQLVTDLSADSFDTRQKATDQLKAMGTAALPYLKEAINSADLEVKKRAEDVVNSFLGKNAEPKSFTEWLDAQKSCEIVGKTNTVPDMLRKELTSDQAKERSESLRDLAAFKQETGYGSFEASKLEKQANEWADMKGTMGRVTELKFNGKQITDDAVANLKNFPNLKSLSLAYTGITDKTLENLKDLGRLRSLSLTDTAITDKGMEHLRHLKNLESLGLDGTKITDAGTEALKDLKYLEELYIGKTKVTDKCLDNLKELPLLKTMYYHESGITDEGMKKLPRVERGGYT
jgi:Leucine-rich repeat (LRR) protein